MLDSLVHGVVNSKETVSNKVEGENQHLLPYDLHM